MTSRLTHLIVCFLCAYISVLLFAHIFGFAFRFFFATWAALDIMRLLLMRGCQRSHRPVVCHNGAVQTDDQVEEEEDEDEDEDEEEEGQNSTGVSDTKFSRFQHMLNFVALPRSRRWMQRKLRPTAMEAMEGDTDSADTSYGITELPHECEWNEGRGGVDGARGACAERMGRRKAKDCSKKEREWEWERGEREEREKNGRMEKEVKREKADQVISGLHQLDGKPKKTRGGCSRLFTNTIGALAWHRPQQQRPHRRSVRLRSRGASITPQLSAAVDNAALPSPAPSFVAAVVSYFFTSFSLPPPSFSPSLPLSLPITSSPFFE
ncbi:hypothetical protein TSMEX_008068 [Taenia solium]|eukprot:TsM_000060400 transcript=TsM_000060400 gene=TsM_000060400